VDLWKIDHKNNDFWVIVNSRDILVNLFTEPEREEYDLERVWVLRREKNPFIGDSKEETEFVYDEDDCYDDDNEYDRSAKNDGFGGLSKEAIEEM